MRKYDNAVVGEKPTHYESSVKGCIVIMEQPVALMPQFRSFLPNVLPQTAKNITVEPGIHGLAFGGIYMVHNPSNVENTMSVLSVTLQLCLAFFGLGDRGLFHCEDCCLVSGSYL